MTTATRLKNVWDIVPLASKKIQAKHMLENCKMDIIHEINKLIIFELSNHFQVINKQSLVVKYFDTKDEAIKHCLDIYPNSFFNSQTNLFE